MTTINGKNEGKRLVRKIDISNRHTLRGLKKCPSCGEMNGHRSLLCRNTDCELRKITLATFRPFDPVQLVTHTETLFYSVRNKERDAQPRNFVSITDVTLALEQNSAIVSRNAICFVDTCKYDAGDATGIACKHIKACSASGSALPQAEAYPIAREVLFNLNIDNEQKQQLWNMYKADEQVPTVQRLNTSTFVVKCVQSKLFPAGRLHVTAVSNGHSTKKGIHACACKKLSIIVEPDNSVVMHEICDHLLLVLAAILSKPNGKTAYGNFTNALKTFWMPEKLETPLLDEVHDDAFLGMSINIGGNFKTESDQTAADDIFIFSDEFLVDDKLPDFSDIILDLGTTATHTSHVTSTTTTTTTSAPFNCNSCSINSDALLYAGDPNMVSSCNINEEDVVLPFDDICTSSTSHLELTDCNIELMDQFQLTDQIDLCSDDIAIPVNSEPILSILTPPVYTENLQSISVSNNDMLPVLTTTTAPSLTLKPNQVSSTLPPIELPTIAVVKKVPIKAADIVTEVKTRKHPHIPAKRAVIVNTTGNVALPQMANVVPAPALAYSAWLDYVIERINDSVEIVEIKQVAHSFHVHGEIFSHFCKSFTVGVKRRIPNKVVVIKQGKCKGLIKYVWFFTTPHTVNRIFTTANNSIQLERAFELKEDGSYEPYVRKPAENVESKHRRVYPKLTLYMAHIWFDNKTEVQKNGLKLEWIPDAFPKSRFGIFNVEFNLGIREPLKL